MLYLELSGEHNSGTACIRHRISQLGSESHIVLGLQYQINITILLLDTGKYCIILDCGHTMCSVDIAAAVSVLHCNMQ